MFGQTTSYVDLVPRDGPEAVLPDSREAIELALNEAANLPQGDFVGSLITPDRRKDAVQVLLKDGDNQAIQRVVDRTESFLESSPLPVGTRAEWAGETYLNLV